MSVSSHWDDMDLMAYADGELSDGTRRDIRAHLTTCPDCRARLDQWDDLIHRIGTGADQAHPVDLRPAVMRSLRREHTTSRRVSWLLLAELAAGAALSAILVSALRQVWLTAALIVEPLLGKPTIEVVWGELEAQIAQSARQLAELIAEAISAMPRVHLDGQVILGWWPWLAIGVLVWLLINGLLISGGTFARLGTGLRKREHSG